MTKSKYTETGGLGLGTRFALADEPLAPSGSEGEGSEGRFGDNCSAMLNPLGSLARELFGTSQERRFALLSALWPRVVGPEVARRSRVLSLDGERLRVKLAHGAWRKTIGRMRGEILLRLRDAAGPLAPRGLVFFEGTVEQEAAAPQRPPQPPSGPLPEVVHEASRAIEDPEIREAFRASAARYLARGGR